MLEVILLAAALAMDAFAVALVHGAVARPGWAGALTVGLAFGLAQGLMPLFGWSLGQAFAGPVEAFDHWIAFALLGGIGVKMIHDAAAGGPEATVALAGWGLLTAAVATSVDAAAAGVTLPALGAPVGVSVVTIGLLTAALCVLGVRIGRGAGAKLGRWAGLAGGVALIGLGAKILVEHLSAA